MTRTVTKDTYWGKLLDMPQIPAEELRKLSIYRLLLLYKQALQFSPLEEASGHQGELILTVMNKRSFREKTLFYRVQRLNIQRVIEEEKYGSIARLEKIAEKVYLRILG